MVKKIHCRVIKSITPGENTSYLYDYNNICEPENYYLRYAERNKSRKYNIRFGHYIKLISALSVPYDAIGQFLDFHF